MDPKAVWHVNQRMCQLDDQQFSASLQLDKPSLGLLDTQVHGELVGNHQFLKIIQQDENETAEVSDFFIRGSDLVVTFAQHKERSVQPQVYWRYSRFDDSTFVVDIVISVQTSLLESNPTISVQSIVQNAKLLEWNKQQLTPIEWGDRGFAESSGVAVCQFADSNVSFMTAVHPSDFQSFRFERTVMGNTERTVLKLDLFQHELEKGVIRRGRVRGVFLQAGNELEVARKISGDLANQPPPLTT